MKIKYNLDRTQYQRKLDKKKNPEDEVEIENLRKRLCATAAIVETEPEELITAIERGQTFTPGVMTGTKAATWKSQQIIVADIDNDRKDKTVIESPMTPEIAYMLLTWHDIHPYCMYYTFSNTENHPKFRIMIVLDRPITDPKESLSITKRFTAIFNDYTSEKCADTTMRDNARLLYGTRPGSVFYYEKAITPLDIMRSLPESKKTSKTPEKKSVPKEAPRKSYDGQDNFDLTEPLSYIPPEDYEEWIKCGIALKCEGYSVSDWDAWSRGSTKYEPGECEKKWDTFDVDSKTVSGGYIVNLAKQYGYVPPKDRPHTMHTGGQSVSYEFIPLPTDKDAPGEIESQTVPEVPDEQKPSLSAQDEFDRFLSEIESNRFEPIPTGIDQLDKALEGGLERRTLVTLAAAPGAGKTAIAQYIFENMAENGHNVVYVNLEMDRSQLLSRSIARLSHEYKIMNGLHEDVTALQVKRGYQWTSNQKKIVQNMSDYYREKIAPHFRYVTTNRADDGHIENNLSAIRDKLQTITVELIRSGQEAPIVCIDYLQFIGKDEDSKKLDNADFIKKVLDELKNFALQYNTVVFVITANNRASNSEGRASMDSARDTSNIEYSGDVMLSLVYTAVEEHWQRKSGKKDAKQNDKYTAVDNDFINTCVDFKLRKRKEEGKLEDYPLIAKLVSLKVVKGRSIQSRGAANFIFDGRYFYFRDADTATYFDKLTHERKSLVEELRKRLCPDTGDDLSESSQSEVELQK